MERVDIIGGGPGGLLLAILLRRREIAADVRVFEKNAQDNTYGWAVVFPEGALDELAKADPQTFSAIANAGVAWTPVDVRYRDLRWCVKGNHFQGIARTTLLAILHDIATDLGVKVRYNHPVDDLADHADADLVVGADGVNSVVRQAFPESFRPNLEYSPFKYRWLGVDRVYPYFTYIFQETEWGLMQAYIYPSGKHWSSLIVHVAEEAWHRTGLATMDDAESVRFCEEVFAQHLDGAAVLSQDSQWANFPHLRCGSWHHDNKVLIGDAAHTAHWSIGSGTRLAIGDAIELAGHLAADAEPLTTRLEQFETARRPTVQKFQDAARASEWYFENLNRYLHFEPIQFVYQLMARSWRITHGDIARLDPKFIAEFDSWFHGQAAGAPVDIAPPPAFAPARIGELRLPNRVVTEDTRTGGGLRITTRLGDGVASGTDASCLRLASEAIAKPYHQVLAQAKDGGHAMVLLDGTQADVFEVLAADRPEGLPIAVALPVPRPTEQVAAEITALARSLRDAGADAVLLRTELAGRHNASHAPRVVQIAATIRNTVGLPVIVDGVARTRDDIDTIVASGWADLVVLPAPGESERSVHT